MELPYSEIKDYPKDYSEQTIVSRLIDGLGYRYFWATEGLRSPDLLFRPTTESMSSQELLSHILTLSETVLNTIHDKPNIRPESPFKGTYEEIRKMTLNNLSQASSIFSNENPDLSELKVTFKRGERVSSFPFWNLINGQIADALTHVGQIASYRRQSGNPQSSKVNVFMGRNRG